MAEASDQSGDAPTREEEHPVQTFTLHIVSPSVGVASPLVFSDLQQTTTVKELKSKIRDVLPSKPADESQRLIHRGRMLSREQDTMRDVFGQGALEEPVSQTLHLVLRPTTADGPGAPPAPIAAPVADRPQVPAFANFAQYQQRPHSLPPNGYNHHPQHPFSNINIPPQHQMPPQAESAYSNMIQSLQVLQRETQRLHQEIGAIEQRYPVIRTHTSATGQPGLGQFPSRSREASPFPAINRGGEASQTIPNYMQNLMLQQQRERAVNGQNGITGGSFRPSSTSGRSTPALRPDHTSTYSREGVGPNGERWNVVVSETTTTIPLGTPPPGHQHHHQHRIPVPPAGTVDVAQFLHNPIPDILAETEARSRAARAARGHVNVDQHPVEAHPGGSIPAVATSGPSTRVSTPSLPNSQNLTGPDHNTSPTDMNDAITSLGVSGEPTVYILSSPSGPRALLVTDQDAFFTPRQSSRSRRVDAPMSRQHFDAAQAGPAVGLPEFRNRNAARAARRNARQEGDNPLVPVAAPHANPQAGAVGAQLAPMLWLLVRLVGFVWFFTTGQQSWTRWVSVIGIALAIFLYNAGIFNGIANHFWAPIRGHLEALIPLAGPDAALVPAANAVIPEAVPNGDLPPVQAGPHGELDPAQVAARIVEQQRRQREASWFRTQIRRIEHSLLLFLASLVPGVGERHIAAREAERQRQIEAANTAANPPEATAPTESATQQEDGNQEVEGNVPPENDGQQPPVTPVAPLIEV